MCLQCCTEAEVIGVFPFSDGPQYAIMRSTRHHEDWPLGYYGLVSSNDPDCIWSNVPSPEPPEPATENGPEWEEWWGRWEEWWQNAASPIAAALDSMSFNDTAAFVSQLSKHHPPDSLHRDTVVGLILEMQLGHGGRG
jgi:hypothetical protein